MVNTTNNIEQERTSKIGQDLYWRLQGGSLFFGDRIALLVDIIDLVPENDLIYVEALIMDATSI